MHPEKSHIFSLDKGITFLGYRIFNTRWLLKRSNARMIWKRLDRLKEKSEAGGISIKVAEQSLRGWLAYAEFADTYELRCRVVSRFNHLFASEQHHGFKQKD